MSIAVSTNVWHNSKQKGSALTLLLAMADMANDTGVCWPSVRYLAEKTRMTIRNVQKLLNKLQADGDLIITIGGGVRTPYGATNRYVVAVKNANEGSPVGRADGHPRGERGDIPGVNAATSESSLETSFESSLETKHQTPARASQGGGVKNRLQPVSIDSILDHPKRAEAITEADEHEQMTDVGEMADTAAGEKTPLMARVPPCPTGDETTEIDTASSGDTKPVDVPEYAHIFAIPDAEVRGWIKQEPRRLEAWCAYANGDNGVKSPGGFVRAAMRAGGIPPGKAAQANPYADWMIANNEDYEQWLADRQKSQMVLAPPVEPDTPECAAWKKAYSQLEIQLDRNSFDTWFRESRFLRCDGAVYVIGAANRYARDMLQYRLYRDVRRVLNNVTGKPVELQFEVYQKTEQVIQNV